jgi:hypothetical protein
MEIEDAKRMAAAAEVKTSELSTRCCQLESALKTRTVEKNKMEDQLYRNLAKCINTKKDRIKVLEKQIKGHTPRTELGKFIQNHILKIINIILIQI